jgi:hypothetical protein
MAYGMSRKFGSALIRAGATKGDVMGMVLPNIPEFPIGKLNYFFFFFFLVSCPQWRQLGLSENLWYKGHPRCRCGTGTIRSFYVARYDL